MSPARGLGIQLAATNLICVILYGLMGHWLAGFFAPYAGIYQTIGAVGAQSDPIFVQLRPYAVVYVLLGITVGLSIAGRAPRVIGHLALLAFNVISAVTLLGME